MARYANLDEYLNSLDDDKSETLRQLVDYILSLDPQLETVIAWNVPQIKIGTHFVFGMSAAKNHLTLAPWSSTVFESQRQRMSQYVVNKATFQVPVDWDIDRALIESMIRGRLAEIGS